MSKTIRCGRMRQGDGFFVLTSGDQYYIIQSNDRMERTPNAEDCMNEGRNRTLSRQGDGSFVFHVEDKRTVPLSCG